MGTGGREGGVIRFGQTGPPKLFHMGSGGGTLFAVVRLKLIRYGGKISVCGRSYFVKILNLNVKHIL